MNAQTLFTAIGTVDDIYLLDLEHSNVRRLPKRFGLIAAMLVLLLTACASPAIVQHFDVLRSGGILNNEYTVTWDKLWKNPDDYFINGNYLILHPNTVVLDVTPAADAPETLAQPCIPLALLDYAAIETGELTETALSLELSATVPQYGHIRGILYRQQVIPKDSAAEITNFVDPGLMKENMTVYGSVSALEIDGRISYPYIDTTPEKPVFTGHIRTKHIFWSDGHYLYALKIPITYNLPVTAVEGIVTSLAPVEDISEYLPNDL